MKNYFKKVCLVLCALFFLISCREEHAQEIPATGSVAIGIVGDIADLFPYSAKEYFGREISTALLNPALTAIDDRGQVYPVLAAAWNISPDKLRITYILNQKYKWSNGQKVSAQDIHDTYQFLKKHTPVFDNPLDYGFIRAVQALDSLTVRFTFTSPVSDPLRRTRFAVLNRRQIKDSPGIHIFKKKFREDFVGCGPFLLESRNKGEIKLKANPTYGGSGPYIEHLSVRMYPGSDSIMTALEKKEIDLALALPLRITERKNIVQNYRLHFYPEKGFEFIGWNLKRPHLQDVSIREALTRAIDKPTIVDGVLGDCAQVENNPVFLSHSIKDSDQQSMYDFTKAESLFASRGWKRDRSGFLFRKNKYFSLNILSNEENEIRRELSVNLKGYYKALGVKIRLEFRPWSEVLRRLKAGNFDAVIIRWRENGPYDVMELFHSANITDGRNFLAYSNPRADQLMEWALNTDHQDIRNRTLLKLNQVIRKDFPVTVLFRQKLANIISVKLNNCKGIIRNAQHWSLQRDNK